jgi:hypothetical protein
MADFYIYFCYTFFMFEQPQSPVEKAPNAIEKLLAYLQSLPDNHGIRGQVQIEVLGSEGVYEDSALYGFRVDGDKFSFEAADAGGTIVTYASVDGSINTFSDANGEEHKVVFPGFVIKE